MSYFGGYPSMAIAGLGDPWGGGSQAASGLAPSHPAVYQTTATMPILYTMPYTSTMAATSHLAPSIYSPFTTFGMGAMSSSSAKPAPKIYRLALTGGPCGGKSTMMRMLNKSLEENGYAFYCAPEVPTILISGGAAYPGHDGGQKLIEFETALIKLQLQMEDSFLQIAATSDKPSIVIMDRGLLDISAYLPPEQWAQVLAANGLDEAVLAARYDMVLHLVTAADGAEKFYTTDNNQARTETAEQARELDKKMQQSWASHGNVTVVDNSTSFDQKCQRCVDAILCNLASWQSA